MKIFISATILLISLPLSAGVYKCVDANGNKIYRAQPCSDDQKKAELNLKAGNTRDLDALEKQQKQSDLEQQALGAEKKRQEEEAAKQQADFKQKVLDENEKNQALIKSNPKGYSAYAIPGYPLEALPPLVKRFEKRLPDIERLRREAAEKALGTGECGRVESVELSQKSIEKSLVILVDCSTAKKFYYAERDLEPAPAITPETLPTAETVPAQPPVTVTTPANASPSP